MILSFRDRDTRRVLDDLAGDARSHQGAAGKRRVDCARRAAASGL